MTTNSHQPAPMDPDELANRVVDEAAVPVDERTLDAAQRTRVAEVQLLNALLQQVYEAGRPQAAPAREARVRRVLSALRLEPPSGLPEEEPAESVPVATARQAEPAGRARRSRWRSWSALATAAVLLLALGLWWTQGPQATATAALRQAQAVAQELADRKYRVTIETEGPLGRRTEAQLFVRGGERFALQHPSPLGHFWVGYDGTEAWFAPQIGPILVRSDPVILEMWLTRAGATVPFLQITTILDRMAAQYDLENLPDERLGEDRFASRHICGRRRADAPHGPVTIDLWCHPQTKVARRLALGWATDDGPRDRALQRLEFELQDSQPLPEDFFSHAAHHDPSRRVLSGPAGEVPR